MSKTARVVARWLSVNFLSVSMDWIVSYRFDFPIAFNGLCHFILKSMPVTMVSLAVILIIVFLTISLLMLFLYPYPHFYSYLYWCCFSFLIHIFTHILTRVVPLSLPTFLVILLPKLFFYSYPCFYPYRYPWFYS
jgi:hypothetical protein